MNGTATPTSTYRLHRPWSARLRLLGALEYGSAMGGFLFFLAASLAVRDDHSTGDVLAVAALMSPFLVVFLAVRVAVATEYVEARSDAIAWRGLFRAERIDWHHVAGFEVSTVRLYRGRFWMAPSRILQLNNMNGTTRRFRASVGCDASWAEFVAHAESRRRAATDHLPSQK